MTKQPEAKPTVYFVALCRKSPPEVGDYLVVTTDRDCLPPTVLSVPGVRRIVADICISAAERYVEENGLMDAFSPPIEVQLDGDDKLWTLDKDGNWTDCPDGQDSLIFCQEENNERAN